MDNAGKRRVIMIDLDSILDTRMGLMIHHDLLHQSDTSMKALFSDEYRVRENDDWIAEKLGITLEQWQEKWKVRGELDILPLSAQTFSIRAVLAYISECVADQMKPTTGYDFDLLVNSYPYQLSTEDSQAIIEILDEQAPLFGKVSMTYLPPNRIDPDFFKENLDCYWTYDLSVWLNEHLPWLLNNPRPTIQLITPKLLHSIPKHVEMTDADKEIIDKIEKFELVSVSLSLFVSIHFQDVRDYCVEKEHLFSIVR